ncbi:MAG: hypothetical protein ACRD0P_20510 [Stackebrandtia sp.]
MTYPPQQPEDGWADQQPEQAVDPFASSGAGQSAPPAYPPGYGPQGYGQAPQQPEPATDQTQSLQEHQQPAEEHTQVLGRQPGPEQQSYGQPYQQQPDPGQQSYGQPYQQQPGQQYPAQPQTYGSPAAPVSANPASAQPYSGAPASGQPYPANPTSGQPYPGANQAPPGVPESPFNATQSPFTTAPAPTPMNLPSQVSASPVSGQPWGVTPRFTPKQRKGLPSWVYVIGGVVVVAALAVGAVFYFGLGDETGDTAGEDANGSGEQTQEAFPVTDEKSGLTYLGLPQPWTSLTDTDGFDSLAGFTAVNGQALVTEDGGEDGRKGVFAVGELDVEALKYKDGDALTNVAGEFADLIDLRNWKNPADPDKDLEGLARDNDPVVDYLRVDGRRGVTSTYHISWKSDAVSDSGATVMLGVIDIGDGALAGFFVDIPDSAADAATGAVKDTMLTLQFE